MLDTTLKAQLKSYLQRLQRPIELQARLDAGASSQELRALLADIVECSENNMVTLREVAADGKRTPSFAIAPAGEAPRVEFAGLPMGHEFSSLVLALLQVGGHPVREEEHVLQGIAKLQGERNFEVYISLSCHNCPDVVQALNAMAVLNPGIKVSTVDGALFQDEVTQREVMAVPSVFLNGKPFVSGRIGMQELLERLDEGAAEAQAQRMQEQEPFDVLVVGAGPAGVAAAVYAARKGIRTGMVAQRIGGQTNDTVGIENYISVLETTGAKFSADLQAHVRRYGVEVMEGHQVERLVPPAQVGGLHEVHLANKAVLRARSVVLAPGARWRNMDVPGEAEYKNKGVAYCPHCDGPLFKGKPVAVIGGGNSGVEAAIDLAGVVKHVTVLEYGDSLKADAVLVAKLKSLHNVKVLTQARTTAVLGDGARVHALSYEDHATGQAHQVDLQGVFVQIGLVPNTEFLKGVVELSGRGEIEVDSHGRTNVPGVFAAGDATTAVFKQIVIAAGDGAKAALSAFDYLIRTPVPQDQPAAVEAVA